MIYLIGNIEPYSMIYLIGNIEPYQMMCLIGPTLHIADQFGGCCGKNGIDRQQQLRNVKPNVRTLSKQRISLIAYAIFMQRPSTKQILDLRYNHV